MMVLWRMRGEKAFKYSLKWAALFGIKIIMTVLRKRTKTKPKQTTLPHPKNKPKQRTNKQTRPKLTPENSTPSLSWCILQQD